MIICSKCGVDRPFSSRAGSTGLCLVCYREKHYQVEDVEGEVPDPAESSSAVATTATSKRKCQANPDRIRALAGRASAGVGLFHPGDAKRDLT